MGKLFLLILFLIITNVVVTSFIRTHHKNSKTMMSLLKQFNIEQEDTPLAIEESVRNNVAVGKRHHYILGRMRRDVSTIGKSHNRSEASKTETNHHASEASKTETNHHASEASKTETNHLVSEDSKTGKSHHRSEVNTTGKSHNGTELGRTENMTTTTEYFQSYEDPVDHNFIEVSTKKRVGVKWTEERKKKQAAAMKVYWEARRKKKEREKQEEKEFWEDQTRRWEADTNPLEYVYNYDPNDPKNINPAGRNYTGFKPYIEHYTYLPTNATGNNVWYVDDFL